MPHTIYTQVREPELYFQKLGCNTSYHVNRVDDPILAYCK